MQHHDKSSFELRQWLEHCRTQVKAATTPLGHLSGNASSERIATENRAEIKKIDAEIKKHGDG